jgi:holliday junction DNA helicase RuvB
LRLVFYTPEELTKIVSRAAGLLGMNLTVAGAAEIAACSRGTPRVAGRLTRRVRDFAAVAGVETVDVDTVCASLRRLGVDSRGLDDMAPPAALSEAVDTLEDVVEPYLLQEGLIMRTSRGRILGQAGWDHLGLPPPKHAVEQQYGLALHPV